MDFSFLFPRHETPLTIRQKAEALLSQVESTELFLKNRTIPGETRLNATGREGDFRQFRTYRAEDRPQDVDWKRSARSDDLLIKEREKNQRQSVNLCFAPSKGMDFKSSNSLMTKHEASAVITTAFALWAKQNHSLIYLNGHKIGIDDFAHEALTHKSVPEFKNNALTILAGDFLEEMEALDLLFLSLPERNVMLLQILDPAECELPYHGRSLFEYAADTIIINNVDNIRDDYKTALNKHIDDVRRYAEKRNWYYEFARTDQDLSPVLASIFQKIGDRL